MAISVLISDPDLSWSGKVQLFFQNNSYDCESAIDGKDCQLKVYKQRYLAVLLDLETRNNSSLEVLRYLRLNAPSIKVILTVKDKDRFKEMEFSKDELRKLGASDILIKPFSLESLLESVEGANQFEAWKKIKKTDNQGESVEVTAKDDEFTKIKLRDFYSGNTNVFDCFIRLSKNKYVKILHRGTVFEESCIEKYNQNQEVTHLYFKTKDRAMYINFINTALEKMVSNTKVDVKRKIDTTKNITEKYIEEIYTSGLRPQLIEEGKKLCNNMYELIKKDPGVADIMALYDEYDPPAYAHLFLVSFFSTIACQNLDWSSKRTVEIIGLGALLHDVGKLKLPPEFRGLAKKDMTPEQLEIYKTHPRLGAEMLQQYPLITEPIRQIVYQHHEYVSGDGYPNGLNGIRIYPLAKVVSFVNEFVEFIMERKLSPLNGLREILKDRHFIMRFDPEVVRAFIQAFIKNKR